MTDRPSAVDANNDVQRSHFDRRTQHNPRMRPADTPYVRRHLDRFIDFGDVERGERILEVGCGLGKFTLPLHERGYEIEGLDLSADLLELLASDLPKGTDLPLHCADLNDPPRALRGRFDVVAGFFTLHHLVDLPVAFRSMAHLLSPGGRMVFLEPNAWNPLYYLQVTFTPGMSWRSDRGLLDMTRRKITGALELAGLTDVRHHRFGMFPPQVTNRPWGRALEDRIEAWGALRPISAFQLVSAVKQTRPA